MADCNDNNPVFLSLDDIIRLNKEKNKRSGSVKSFASHRSNRSNYSNRSHKSNYSNRSHKSNYSNRSHKSNYSHRSYKSNYSNRSYGGMSHKSNISTYSNRERRGQRRDFQNYYNEQNDSYVPLGSGSLKFRNQGKGNGIILREFYKNRSYRGSNQSGYNYWSCGRYYNHLHNRNAYNFARNRVKNALNYLNKSQQNFRVRHAPYQNIRKRLTQTFTDNTEGGEDNNELSIVVNNERAFRGVRRISGLTVPRLTKFNENLSPLRKTSLVLSRKTASVKKSSWGPKLNPKIQEEIEQEMQNSSFMSEDLSEVLNESKIVPSTTSLLLHERFGTYL